MKVKELIKKLQSQNQELDVVFWNTTLNENHWGCEINQDDCNNTDLIIVPTIEEDKWVARSN